jgi:hypothetical protein
MTNPDECNIVEVIVVFIVVLVDDDLSNFITLAIAHQIDISSIHQILSYVLTAQILPFE